MGGLLGRAAVIALALVAIGVLLWPMFIRWWLRRKIRRTKAYARDMLTVVERWSDAGRGLQRVIDSTNYDDTAKQMRAWLRDAAPKIAQAEAIVNAPPPDDRK